MLTVTSFLSELEVAQLQILSRQWYRFHAPRLFTQFNGVGGKFPLRYSQLIYERLYNFDFGLGIYNGRINCDISLGPYAASYILLD